LRTFPSATGSRRDGYTIGFRENVSCQARSSDAAENGSGDFGTVVPHIFAIDSGDRAYMGIGGLTGRVEMAAILVEGGNLRKCEVDF